MFAYNDGTTGTLIELGGKTTSMYGVCSTAADAEIKVVEIASFHSIQPGATIRVKFQYANTNTSPKLNVNNIVKPIYAHGTTVGESWKAQSIVQFTYDGTVWYIDGSAAEGGSASVVANPDGPATDTLSKLKVDDTIYSVDGGSSGEVGAKMYFGESTTSGQNLTIVTDIDTKAELHPGDRILVYLPNVVEQCGEITTYNNGTPVTCTIDGGMIVIPDPGYTAWCMFQYRIFEDSPDWHMIYRNEGKVELNAGVGVSVGVNNTVSNTAMQGGYNFSDGTVTNVTSQGIGYFDVQNGTNGVNYDYMFFHIQAAASSGIVLQFEGSYPYQVIRRTMFTLRTISGDYYTSGLTVGTMLITKLNHDNNTATVMAVIGESGGGGGLPSDPLGIDHGGTGNVAGYIRTGLESGSTAGLGATIEGSSNKATGNYSHAEGNYTLASGDSSHAEGFGGGLIPQSQVICYNEARGKGSHVEGAYSSIAEGDYSHAEGYQTYAKGEGSHAEGYTTEARGDYSHAEGYDTSASGDCSHAEGYNAVTQGDFSHAEGYMTLAQGDYSHAEGVGTVSLGDISHAEGYYTKVNGQCAHVGGFAITAVNGSDYSLIHGQGRATSTPLLVKNNTGFTLANASVSKFSGGSISQHGQDFTFSFTESPTEASSTDLNSQFGNLITISAGNTSTCNIEIPIQTLNVMFIAQYNSSNGAIIYSGVYNVVGAGLSSGNPALYPISSQGTSAIQFSTYSGHISIKSSNASSEVIAQIIRVA